jgi:CubicO group peptidase (beta-lactamase class C family)
MTALTAAVLAGVLLSLAVTNDGLRRRWVKLRHAWLPSLVEWPVEPAAEHGFDVAALDRLRDELARRRTSSLLVVRRGRIVYEWYSSQAAADEPLPTASLAKSLVCGTALLVALNDGRLKLDDPAAKYIPAWADDRSLSEITIRQLATHTSGLEDATVPGSRPREIPGWKGNFWRRQPDPYSAVLENARPLFPPGTRLEYSSTGFAALGYAITASLRGTGHDGGIRELVRDRVMVPLDVPRGAWSIGYQAEYELDGLRLHPVWGGGTFTARAAARVGQVLLDDGRREGRPLVDPRWVETVTTYAGTALPDRSTDPALPATAAAWFTNVDGVWPTVPTDAFVGMGKGHQVLLVVPSLDLVVVRFGGHLDHRPATEQFWEAADAHLFRPLMSALTEPR